jgi:maltose alpha-D-glucosyltransferase/alpha-amylase
MGDNIWLDDRNGVRTPMQWDSSPQGGFSRAKTTYAPVIADGENGYQRVNVAVIFHIFILTPNIGRS